MVASRPEEPFLPQLRLPGRAGPSKQPKTTQEERRAAPRLSAGLLRQLLWGEGKEEGEAQEREETTGKGSEREREAEREGRTVRVGLVREYITRLLQAETDSPEEVKTPTRPSLHANEVSLANFQLLHGSPGVGKALPARSSPEQEPPTRSTEA